MSNTANRWKSKGGITRRPMGNIVSNNKSVIMENIITKSLGAELTTIDKYGDIDDMNDGAIYKVDNSSIKYNNVVCYYPFNNLTYNGDVLPATTNQTSISNESKYDALLDPTNMNLSFNNSSSGAGVNQPYVVYDSQYEQNAIQFRKDSKILMSGASFNTANIFGTTSITGPAITTAMTIASYIYIPSGTQNFTIFALDDYAQTGLINYNPNVNPTNNNHNIFYLWYTEDTTGTGYIQMAYCYYYTTVYDDPNSPIPHFSNKYKYINTAIDGTTIDSIVKNKWSKFQMIFNGSSLDLYIDGKEIFHVPTGTASFIPDKPMSINLGPRYLPSAGSTYNSGHTNIQSPADTGVQLLDYKIANYAVSKTLIEFLADPVAGRGHQFVKTQQPNATGEMIYLLSKEAILFDAPTLCQDTLNVGGQLNSYGSNNFYSKNQFFDVAHFHKGVIIDGSSVIINNATNVLGNLDIKSTGTATNKTASLLICNAGGMDPLTTSNSSMPTMLAYNADTLQSGSSTNGLIFSISGENVSVGPTFGTNTFDVKGISRFEGDVVMDDNLSILGAATIGQNADIVGDAIIGGNTEIGGYVDISGNTDISGNVDIGGNANIEGIATIAVNLGIGTTNPSCNLHVKNTNNNVVIQRWDHGGGRVLDLITPSSTGDPFIFSTANAYQFQRDQIVALDINASGNVGIQKLANNSYSLDVSGNVNVSGSINCANPAETENSNIVATTEWVRTYITGPVVGWTSDGTTTATDLSVSVGGNAVFQSDVGIGTTTPGAKLHVKDANYGALIQRWESGSNRILELFTSTDDNNGPFVFNTGNSVEFKLDKGSSNEKTALKINTNGTVSIGGANGGGNQALDVSGNIYINNGLSGAVQGGQLIFDTGSGEQGPNKIKLYGPTSQYGFGTAASTLKYHSYSNHKFYSNSTGDGTDGDLLATLNTTGLDVSGNIYCTTPADTENSNMVATTKWVLDHTSDSGGGWSVANGTTTTTYNATIGGDIYIETGKTINFDLSSSHDNNGLQINSTTITGRSADSLNIVSRGNGEYEGIIFKNIYGGITNEYMRIIHNGNVGIGTTGPSEKLEVNGNVQASGSVFSYNSSGQGTVGLGSVGSTQGSYIYWNLNGDGATHIVNNKGNSLDGGFRFYNQADSSSLNTQIMSIDGTGNISATSFNATSDIRLKENITNLDNSLDKICNIRGVNYNWKSDENHIKHSGVIAQEVDAHIPEAVCKNDTDKYSVDYNSIIAHLIESVKELKREIDELKAK